MNVKKHVFLSYCIEDDAQAKRIYQDLSKRGLEVWKDKEKIGVGEHWKSSIKTAIRESFGFVLCLSANTESRSSAGIYPELDQAIEIYQKLGPGIDFIFPLKLSSCKIPEIEISSTRLLNDLQHAELFPEEQYDGALDRLASALRTARDRWRRVVTRPIESDGSQSDRRKPARLYQLPRLAPTYLQRKSFFDQVVDALDPKKRVWGASISGVGGVGKTSLATDVGRYCGENGEFDHVVWTTAKPQRFQVNQIGLGAPAARGPDEYAGLLDAIFGAFDHSDYNWAPREERVRKAYSLLESARCLLIIDNLESLPCFDSLADFLEQSPITSKTITTTRTRMGGRGERQVSLSPMGRTEVESLVRDFAEFRSIEVHEDLVDTILQILGGVPLAIEWSLLQFRGGRSEVLRFIEKLKDARKGKVTEGQEELLKFCFKESYETLGSLPQKILRVLGLFPIKLSLAEIGALVETELSQVESALDELELQSFTSRDHAWYENVPSFDLLPLVRLFARAEVGPEEKVQLLGRMADQTESRSNRSSICVYTPDFLPVSLPKGSTYLDFAYQIHSEIGHQFESADVRGARKGAFEAVEPGELVEIVTGVGEPSESWLEQVKTPKARQAIQSYLRKPQRYVKTVRRANQEAFRCRPVEAVRELEEARRLDPENTWAMNRLGHAFRLQGDIDQAMSLHQNVLEKNRTDPFALLGLGLIAYQSGDREEGLDRCRKSQREKPDYQNAAICIVRCCLALGRYGEADKEVEKVIGRARTSRSLAVCYWWQMVARLGLESSESSVLDSLDLSLSCFRKVIPSQTLLDRTPFYGSHFLYYYAMALAAADSDNYRSFLIRARGAFEAPGLMQELSADLQALTNEHRERLRASVAKRLRRSVERDYLGILKNELDSRLL